MALQAGTQRLDVVANGPFFFLEPLDLDEVFDVQLVGQPARPIQVCELTAGAGQMPSAGWRSTRVRCETATFDLTGTVEGLQGQGLVLSQGQRVLEVLADGPFSFSQVDDWTPYRVEVLASPVQPSQRCTVIDGKGLIDGGSVEGIGVHCEVEDFVIGGTVDGLEGEGLSLRLGDELLQISGDGSFDFGYFPDLTPYSIAIASQPVNPPQDCTLIGGDGALNGADQTEIRIECITPTWTLGGQVQGLLGQGLVLGLVGVESLPLGGDGAFTFLTGLPGQREYEVQVEQRPIQPSQTCKLLNAVGQVNAADLLLSCQTDAFSVGGTVSDLVGSGLTLAWAEVQAVASDGAFSFGPFPDLTPYDLRIAVQPSSPAQSCELVDGIGQLSGADAGLQVHCVADGFLVTGRVDGLARPGLRLQLNGGEQLEISHDGVFGFNALLADLDPYSVQVVSVPDGVSCEIHNNEGQIAGQNTRGLALRCLSVEPVYASATGWNQWVPWAAGAPWQGLDQPCDIGCVGPVSAAGCLTSGREETTPETTGFRLCSMSSTSQRATTPCVTSGANAPTVGPPLSTPVSPAAPTGFHAGPLTS